MLRKSNRKKLLLAFGAFLLIAGGVAYAYWSSSGTGTGTAVTGTTTGITVNQTSTAITNLYPGVSPQALSGNFDNGNTGAARVHQVSATISSVTGPNVSVAPACTAADYQLNGFPYTVDAEVAAGTGVGSWGTTAPITSIQMLDSATNQDSCKGATVHLSYTSN